VPGVVGQDGGVAGGEVEGAGCGLGLLEDGLCELGVEGDLTYVSDESCGAGGAGEEVEPFFGL